MITYNFIIIENKITNSYLNILNEDVFFDKIWDWCYSDDLWDFLDENPEYLSNSEDLEDYLLNVFIPETLFHNDEDDDSTCFAFTVSDEKLKVIEYNEDRVLPFVLNKIKEYYTL